MTLKLSGLAGKKKKNPVTTAARHWTDTLADPPVLTNGGLQGPDRRSTVPPHGAAKNLLPVGGKAGECHSKTGLFKRKPEQRESRGGAVP